MFFGLLGGMDVLREQTGASRTAQAFPACDVYDFLEIKKETEKG